jgi:hypothetical protein
MVENVSETDGHNFHFSSFSSLTMLIDDYIWQPLIYWLLAQVQEKKIKKVSDMNLDPSKALGNGSVASSSNSVSPKAHLANGGYPSRLYGYLSSDFSFPPGGIPSLRLPMVVVLDPICWFSFCTV